MKKLIVLALVLISSTALAAGFLEVDKTATKIQGYSPDGTLGQALTVNSTTVDMTNAMAFGVYVPSTTTTCKIRTTATIAKGANRQATVPDSVWNIRIVNKLTPYANFSGCTSGELTIQ